jgi:DNA polymerase-3 subunit epsilon
MTCLDSALPLSQLEVLAVDCQATAAAPGGHLLEVGWACIVGGAIANAHARLIRPPKGARIPPAVTRVTGISSQMLRHAMDAGTVWLELSQDAARLSQQPVPAVIHFARFEQPFLRALGGDGPHLDVVCAHEMARRLLPHLPRRSLRALAGYFGAGVGRLRRSADHVRATAIVWHGLVSLLDAEGVGTWTALKEWLARPAQPSKCFKRAWPMPRARRLELPDAPGVYRFLRSSGDVVYVGKAASLHDRVNSYFRHQHGLSERMLEMLSQARAVSFDVTPTALEAALFEPVEIKRHRPPYNIALADDDERQVWFSPPDLSRRRLRSSPRCCVGPFPSHETLDRFAALARGDRRSLAHGRSLPDAEVFKAGYERLLQTLPQASTGALSVHRQLLGLGTRLWREGQRDRRTDRDNASPSAPPPNWTPELVQQAAQAVSLRAALARRRAMWLTRLTDATVVWREPGEREARLLMIENGDIGVDVARATTAPVPPGHARPVAARHERLTVARFDRLRVLTTELKRLSAERAYVAVRFGTGPELTGARLASALRWL